LVRSEGNSKLLNYTTKTFYGYTKFHNNIITCITHDAPTCSSFGWNEPSRTNPNLPFTWVLAHESKWSRI